MKEDALKVERWVGEGIIKCAHIVLSSRIYRCSRTLPPRSRSNWFKLEVEEVEDAARDLDRYRKDVSRPLVIEIYLQPWRSKGPAAQEAAQEQLLERWELQFDGIPPTQQPGTYSAFDDMPTLIYKRMVVMVRSLYSYVRVLPAYRLYRTCREQRAATFNISYRLSDSLDRPAARQADAFGGTFERFALTPIETLTGNLKICVEYQSQHHVAILHAATQNASIPQHIIPDYVRIDGHPGARHPPRAMLSASAFVGPSPPAAAQSTPGGAADAIVGAGYNMISRAYSAARASSQRLFSPRGMGLGSSPGVPAWVRTAPAWHQGQLGPDWPNFDTSLPSSRPSSASKPPLPCSSPINTMRPAYKGPFGPGSPSPVNHTPPPRSTVRADKDMQPSTSTAPIHIAHPRGGHGRTPSGVSIMPSSAPEVAFAHQANSGSPYSLHMRGQMRHNLSHRNLTEITTVGFQATGEGGAPSPSPLRLDEGPPQTPPRSALYGALHEAGGAREARGSRGEARGRHAAPSGDSCRHSAGSSASAASNMSCSPAVHSTALVSRKPSLSSTHSVDMAGMSLDRRSLTVMMESGDSKFFSPQQHSFEVPVPWAVGGADREQENAMYGPLRLELPSSLGNASPRGLVSGLGAESSLEDAKNTSSLQQEDSLECGVMFAFDSDASSRMPQARGGAAATSGDSGEGRSGPAAPQRAASRRASGWGERVSWQDMTASAPAATHARTSAASEQELKNFINMLCKADEFDADDGGQDTVARVQAELVQLSAKWSHCIY